MPYGGARRMLAPTLGVVVLVALLHGCGKPGSPAKKDGESEGTGQPETTAPQPSAKTHASGGSSSSASGGTSGEEWAAHSEADCRLVLYVADKSMSRKEAEAFSKLLTEMIRSMEGLSWSEGALRNAALDHLAVPRYRKCRHT